MCLGEKYVPVYQVEGFDGLGSSLRLITQNLDLGSLSIAIGCVTYLARG